MKISIITVVLNGNKYIEDAMKSVLTQTYSNIEYIVIDGGSSDGTIEKINIYKKKISKFISEPDKGIYEAMNKGIQLASGEIIGFLNSDDVYADSEVINDVANSFKGNKIDGCYGDLIYVNSSLKKTIRYWKSGLYKDGAFGKGWMIPHPTLFISKAAYKKHGVYRTDFKISADYELMLRFIEKNKIILYYISRIFVKMRIGGKSNIGIKNLVIKSFEDLKAWRVNGMKAPFFLVFKKPITKLSQFYKK